MPKPPTPRPTFVVRWLSDAETTPHEVLAHVASIHDRSDLDEGDLAERVLASRAYRRAEVAVAHLDPYAWAIDDALVEVYAARRDGGEVFPDIVLAADGTFVDGAHRAAAALALGEVSVGAMVAVR